MKLFVTLTTAVVLALPAMASASLFIDDAPKTPAIAAGSATFQPLFSPADNVEAEVVKEILSAKKTIRIAANLFASRAVSESLVKAVRENKCDVKVVLDAKSNQPGNSNASFLRLMTSPPHLIKNFDNLYSSYIVIDDSDVILGNSVRVTDLDAEKKNPISVVIIRGAPELAQKYTANWQTLWDSSEEMKDKKK